MRKPASGPLEALPFVSRLALCGALCACGSSEPKPIPSFSEPAPTSQPPTSPTGPSTEPVGPASPSTTPTTAEAPSAEGLGRGDTMPPVTGTGGGAAMPPGETNEVPTLTDDRCDVAVHDPARPPAGLELTGNLDAHDPTLLEQDGVFYLFVTGRNIGAKTSTDLLNWERQPEVFEDLPRPVWLAENVPGVGSLWAPDVSFFGGQYHLYYSASTFGENTSCIGHLSRASLATGTWTEQGPVICSGNGNDYNAIDPNVVVDVGGTAWLSFGSFWDGIKAIELDAAGARANTEVLSIASRGGGAIEAPVIVRRCGYYYLFVSFDVCCRGADSTYNVRVGRSESVMGPYVDREGRALLDGGGTQLTQPDDTWRGPGHNTVLFTGDRAYNVYHAYAASNGASRLRISELTWDETGWPISGGP